MARVSEILQKRLKKAFEKVSHRRLLWKLEQLGGVIVNSSKVWKTYEHSQWLGGSTLHGN